MVILAFNIKNTAITAKKVITPQFLQVGQSYSGFLYCLIYLLQHVTASQRELSAEISKPFIKTGNNANIIWDQKFQ